MNTEAKRKIAITEDPYCDYNFKFGHFVPLDPDEVPPSCDPAYQYDVDKSGFVEGLLPDLWSEQFGEEPDSKSSEDVLEDLKEYWIIIPIKTLFSPYLEFELLPLSIDSLNDCDAVYIANKSTLECSEDEAMQIIEKDLKEFAEFYNMERWRVWLYEDDIPEEASMDDSNEMVLVGSLDEIIPKVRDILPEEYKPIWDAGKFDLCP